jgi:hypothetical protein
LRPAKISRIAAPLPWNLRQLDRSRMTADHANPA